jgi:hypothetical protein
MKYTTEIENKQIQEFGSRSTVKARCKYSRSDSEKSLFGSAVFIYMHWAILAFDLSPDGYKEGERGLYIIPRCFQFGNRKRGGKW